MRRIPLIATVIVLIAVAIMIRLGFWQLGRLHEKEALLARYGAAATQAAPVDFPTGAGDDLLYRHSQLDCAGAAPSRVIAGRSAKDQPGWAHLATCTLRSGQAVPVVLGWSADPAPRTWPGGHVTGTIAPGPRLVADPPLAGLDSNAKPDPRDIPNNHLSYAVQWFAFALVALVIYAIALRKRLNASPARGGGPA